MSGIDILRSEFNPRYAKKPEVAYEYSVCCTRRDPSYTVSHVRLAYGKKSAILYTVYIIGIAVLFLLIEGWSHSGSDRHKSKILRRKMKGEVKHHYDEISSEADSQDTLLDRERGPHDGLLDPSRRPRRRWLANLLPWGLVVLLSAVVIWQSVFYQIQIAGYLRPGTYKTDFEFMQPYVQYHQVRFYSGIGIGENGTLERQMPDAGAVPYVGAPAEELDRNWEELLKNRYHFLTSEEVADFNKDAGLPKLTPSEYPGRDPIYVGGIEMLHSLHCLNTVRKHLDPDFHMKGGLMSLDRDLHLDHCVDHLRQAILCHGDTTPVTMKPAFVGKEYVMLGETSRLHTCRNGQLIRDGVQTRGGLDISRLP